jgi:transposase
MEAHDMDAREQKGLQIAATLNIQRKGDGWIVPSQTLVGRYTVTRGEGGFQCSCPDFELRHTTCKHGYAVEFFLRRETTISPDGSETVTETRAMRVSYPQDWSAYNRAQTAEKELFCHLLSDLCATVPEPVRSMGRPSVPLAEALFCACFKVYSGMSARRFMSDLRDAQAKGFVSRAWHFNSVLKVIEDETITPTLHRLIAQSAAPLGSVESAFAVDSTGFGTQCYYRHFSAKYGHEQYSHHYVKLHALVGTKTNVIAAATITDQKANDYPELEPLVKTGAQTFSIAELSADKAYIGRSNLAVIDSIGAEAFIPFRKDLKDDPKSPLWSKLFHLYSYRSDEFLPYYHKRSNAESTFSAIKRLIGDTLRSKGTIAQMNELLLMVLAYNITVMIHSIFELGVTIPGLSACTQTALAAHNVG